MKRPGELAIKILKFTALSGAFYFSLQNPKMIKSFYEFLNKKMNSGDVKRSLLRLKQRKMVELQETKDGYSVRLSRNGRDFLKKIDLDHLEIKKPSKWDKKWRIVFFDIPETKKKERDFFAQKLKDIGFYRFQESVFIFPYECGEEILFLTSLCGIERFVTIGRLEYISDHVEIMKYFFDR